MNFDALTEKKSPKYRYLLHIKHYAKLKNRPYAFMKWYYIYRLVFLKVSLYNQQLIKQFELSNDIINYEQIKSIMHTR